MANPRIPSFRVTPDNTTVAADLGLLAELAGTWEGDGFNLIARPDFHDSANLYLQLNQTREHLKIDAIGSAIPNRGFGQDDIDLFGLNYLQKIHDASTGGALHLEPGLWITQPATTFPPETAPTGAQIIARMGSIPHGNALLAEGIAEPFTGTPVLAAGAAQYAFSRFPSFNSTPFGVPPTAPVAVFCAAGSSEAATAAANALPPFDQYNLGIASGAGNPRTPFDTSPAEPPLPANINGVPMQTVVNDPITLLQQTITDQVKNGHSFEGTVLNIATVTPLNFLKTANSAATGPSVPVALPDAGGGIENIPFLSGEQAAAPGPEENAQTQIVYATFWIEKVKHATIPTFMQLQYAQMVVLAFPIFKLLNPAPTTPPTPPKFVNIGWPHISVATLRKSFD
jgi:hypothetical protein